MSTSKQPLVWLPLIISVSVVLGVFVGTRFSSHKFLADHDRKLNMILNLIADDYVDTMTISDLVEMTIPELLSNLDPHTTYLDRKSLREANEDIEGVFSGIVFHF